MFNGSEIKEKLPSIQVLPGVTARKRQGQGSEPAKLMPEAISSFLLEADFQCFTQTVWASCRPSAAADFR